MRAKLKNADVHNRYRQVTTCTGYTIKDEFAGVYINTRQMIATLILATVLLGVTFLVQPVNFWLAIAVTNLVLAVLARVLGGWSVEKRNFDLETFLIGILSAAALFALCWLGKMLLDTLAPTVPFLIESLNAIYAWGEQVPVYLIVPVLLLITSPCEEIFWRGFVQRGLMQSYGLTKGWLLGAVLYAAIHIVSLNPILIACAFIAGLLWGYLYLRQHHIACCIVAHALWSVAVFVVWPLFW